MDDPAPSGVAYAGPPQRTQPVLPLQVFGVGYDLDLVLVSDHPQWDMHELARVATPDGPVWLCKDSRAGTLEQTIAADVPDLHAWLPEVPLRRFPGPVSCEDRSTPTRVDLSLAWTNPDGVRTEAVYRGPTPAGPKWRRNSSTMGHSRDAVLAVLDLSHMSFAQHASLAYDGQPARVRRILGLVPFQVALVQVQAGFSVGAFQQHDDGRTVHGTVEQRWAIEPHEHGVALVQHDPLRTLRFVFHDHDGALELARAEVVPFDRDVPACVAVFDPCLPDLRRPFEGVFEGRWALDVNGQEGHATGHVVAEHTDEGVVLRVVAKKPRWCRDRPLTSTVRLVDGVADVQVVRGGLGGTLPS